MGFFVMNCAGQVRRPNRRQVFQEVMHPVGLRGRKEKREERDAPQSAERAQFVEFGIHKGTF
jgi:hypothetical protein